MADVYLVCEGPADGLDSRALDAVVAQILRVPVIVSPAGGDSSLASVASWLEERSRRTRKDGTLGPPSDRAFSIEDRDYRPRAEADASWHTKGNKRLMWRRHEVENYLLEPGVVLRAFDSLRRTVTFPWARKLPTEELAVAELLADLARPMSEDHAGRLLHWELRRAKGNAGVTDLPLPSSIGNHREPVA
ncbi:MAG: hypothetical protein FJ278_14035 [Planctomycetes bacterium]|nr:hypothetical protein [Planctomycetota bacterium]